MRPEASPISASSKRGFSLTRAHFACYAVASLIMDQAEQESYRRPLQDLLEELRADLVTSEDAAQTVRLDSSIGRLSRMDAMQSQQMALELRRRQQNQRQRIENALLRIDKGSYGQCGRCHNAIGQERLAIQPEAILCVHCAGDR